MPLLALGTVAAALAALHSLFAHQPAFWIALFLGCGAAHFWLQPRALRRLDQLARAS